MTIQHYANHHLQVLHGYKPIVVSSTTHWLLEHIGVVRRNTGWNADYK